MTGDQEDDRINLRVVLLCGSVVIAVTILSAWGATTLVGKDHAPTPQPTAPGRGKPFGMLEHGTFDDASDAQHLRQEQARQLVSYGWVDRDAGIVHIPVDRAMELIAGSPR